MGGLFGGGGMHSSSSPQTVYIPSPAPPDDTAAQAAADARRKAAMLAKGRESTILTSGLGDYSPAPTQQTVLGVQKGKLGG